MIPHRTPFFLPWLYPTFTWRKDASEKTLYLTFDDGPVYGPTEFVLDTLASYKIQATFFCIGDNVRKHPAVYDRIRNEGHAIGNHTYHHVKGWKTSKQDYWHDVKKCDDVLQLDSRVAKPLFRPPYGRITRAQMAGLQHYQIVMWDVLTQDYDKSQPKERCLEKSCKATRNGSIVVFHDSVKAFENLAYTLPRYIEHCLGEGYQFKKLV
jgi:peptidoglycan/xylan/chitin deacetylase (PgdA/CDA1 family)